MALTILWKSSSFIFRTYREVFLVHLESRAPWAPTQTHNLGNLDDMCIISSVFLSICLHSHTLSSLG
ncbi:hypothetical protein H5410_004087 [Solanum commersonii]|uniref:Uncharacterized protein n=1 Tax=Solanum commersonii TaxID=4109 RepID=A0A9J6B6Z0_SOLCO|nr:hypothetical protein H5410_004087 [Solanum commersonii]